MTLPLQAKPVIRATGSISPTGVESIAPSACCVRVLGKCVLELPICP